MVAYVLGSHDLLSRKRTNFVSLQSFEEVNNHLSTRRYEFSGKNEPKMKPRRVVETIMELKFPVVVQI